MSKIHLDPDAPNAAFILGAALSGGDPIQAAKMFQSCDGTGDCNNSPCAHDDKPVDSEYRCTHVGIDGVRCTEQDGHEEFVPHDSRCDRPQCCPVTATTMTDEQVRQLARGYNKGSVSWELCQIALGHEKYRKAWRPALSTQEARTMVADIINRRAREKSDAP